MEWGSAYIYDYQHSSEEELSCTELEEGMWLSDSEEDVPKPASVPAASNKPQRANRRSFLDRMFGRGRNRQTKKEPKNVSNDDDNSDDDTSDELSDEDSPSQVPEGAVEYSELQFPPPVGGSGKGVVPKLIEAEEIEGSPGKYAQLAEMMEKEKEESKVEATNDGASVPNPPAVPPPPPVPVHAPMKHVMGIMRGGGIKKQKKRRVRWDKSYSKPKDSSRGGVRTRRTDTNILAVKFNSLAEAGNLHTGDAELCSNEECGAIVSHLTKLEGKEEDMDKIWTCEFCGFRNKVALVPEEVPTLEDTTYLLTPAAALQTSTGGGEVGPVGSDSLVVFCIDTSGSMCVTTEVPGNFDIKGAKERKEKLLRSLPTSMDVDFRREDQYMLGQRRDATYISRMESVQAAVDTQLSQLAHTEPAKRVCLVTFSNDVVIFGDGRSVPVTIAGDKLKDSKAIVDTGSEIPLPAAVRDTHKALSTKIYSLEESGQTALGPAVLVSIVIASQKPGSKVIVCTDGLANVGLGGLDVPEKAYASAVNFYDDLADIALEKGVTMSLLKIKGSDCRAVELGQVASRSGGHVTTVDPLTVTEEFGSILTNPIIATNVVSKVVLHQKLYIRSSGDDTRESVLVKQVGNVTADTELTYEYGVKTKAETQPPKEQKKKKPSSSPKSKPKSPPTDDGATKDGKASDEEEEVKSKGGATGGASAEQDTIPAVMVNGQPNYPFQLQIEYTSLEGDKCLRVITQAKPLTKDRELAEKEMDVGVVGSHVARKTAELAMQGEFTQARVKSLSAQKMLHEQSRSSDDRRWEYTNFCYNMIPVENEIQRMQLDEDENLSCEEYEEETIERGSELGLMSFATKRPESIGFLSSKHSSEPKKPLPKRKIKSVARRTNISDELSEGLYGFQKSSSDAFRKR